MVVAVWRVRGGKVVFNGKDKDKNKEKDKEEIQDKDKNKEKTRQTFLCVLEGRARSRGLRDSTLLGGEGRVLKRRQRQRILSNN